MSLPQVSTLSGRGGGDVAEDVVGALEAVAAGSHASNTSAMPPLGWRGRVRFCVVITDAPTHGQHEECGATSTHEDHLHATSAYLESVVKMLAQGRINTMVCTLNKNATRATVSALEAAYKDAPGNFKMPKGIPLFQPGAGATERPHLHFIFVLDESTSMRSDWSDLERAYRVCIDTRLAVTQGDSRDLVSIIQFTTSAKCAAQACSITAAPASLDYTGGGTKFGGAIRMASSIISSSNPPTHIPVIVFMTDGCPGDGNAGATEMDSLRTAHKGTNVQVSSCWLLPFVPHRGDGLLLYMRVLRRGSLDSGHCLPF